MHSTSERYRQLPGYPLAGVSELRRHVEDAGVEIIDLGSGDADLDPPPSVVARLREVAGERSYSRYPYQTGLPALREAITHWMSQRFGVDVDPWKEVLPLIGSKEGLAHLPFAFVGPGDVPIIADPV